MTILILGMGEIGVAIRMLLHGYVVLTLDCDKSKKDEVNFIVDGESQYSLGGIIEANNITTVINCLPFDAVLGAARIAIEHNCNYFDLTEDEEIADQIRNLALSPAYTKVCATQCGLAPGMVNIIAASMMRKFDSVDAVRMCCGSIPQFAEPPFFHNCNWSPAGMVNEYKKRSSIIINKGKTSMASGFRMNSIVLDGAKYELVATSGGYGSMMDSYAGKLNTMYYMTIRHDGHIDSMSGMNIADCVDAMPKVDDDMVLIFISVDGYINKKHTRKQYYSKTLPICGFSAIQASTAISLVTVVREVLDNPGKYTGILRQEEIEYTNIKHYVEGVFSDLRD